MVIVDLADRPEALLRAVGVRDAFAGAALWLLRFARASDALERLVACADLLRRILGEPGGAHAFGLLVQYFLVVGGRTIEIDAIVRTLREHVPIETEKIVRTIADELIAKGKIEGKLEGKIEGKIEALRSVLAARFGKLPATLDATLGRITEASALDRLTVIAATTKSIADFERSL